MNSYDVEKYRDKAIIINEENYLDPSKLCIPGELLDHVDKIMISQGLIQDRIEYLAHQIAKDAGSTQLTFLVIMKGAINFASSLQAKLSKLNNQKKGFLSDTYEYLRVSSYKDTSSTGKITIKTDESVLVGLKGKDVVILEDIYDSGHSLSQLLEYFKQFEFKSLRIGMLLVKMNPLNLQYDIKLDYIGFLIPNHFVLGWGLDLNEKFRDIEHLFKLKDSSIEKLKDL